MWRRCNALYVLCNGKDRHKCKDLIHSIFVGSGPESGRCLILSRTSKRGKNKSAKVVSKNTVQLVKLLHENAVELAEGERPELWISPEGKLFFKNGKKEQNEI